MQAQAESASSELAWEGKLTSLQKQQQLDLDALRRRLEQQDAHARSANLTAEQYKAK